MSVSLLSAVDPLLCDLTSLSLSDQACVLTTDMAEDSVQHAHLPPLHRDEVEVAFSRILLRDDELTTESTWLGTDDGLDAWFPEDD